MPNQTIDEERFYQLLKRANEDLSATEQAELLRDLAELVGGDPMVFLVRRVDFLTHRLFEARADAARLRQQWDQVEGFARSNMEMFDVPPKAVRQVQSYTVAQGVLDFLRVCQSVKLHVEKGRVVFAPTNRREQWDGQLPTFRPKP